MDDPDLSVMNSVAAIAQEGLITFALMYHLSDQAAVAVGWRNEILTKNEMKLEYETEMLASQQGEVKKKWI